MTDAEQSAVYAQAIMDREATVADLLAALIDLTLRCDGPEGVRADGSNIQTIRAHAVIAKFEVSE